MLDLSSKSLGLWAGIGTAAFLGYCIYFDRFVHYTLVGYKKREFSISTFFFRRKRRSHPDFRRKLREKRKAAARGGNDSSGPQLPDFSDQEAVQRFFLQEVSKAQRLV